MRRRLHTHQKNTKIPTQEPSTAPAQGMFQPRPFGEPSPTVDLDQQPDIKTSLMQAERYGHHLSQMHDTDVSVPQVTQPKMGMGRAMQSEPAAQLSSKRGQPSSGGRSLPENVQQKMEAAFSTDFSNVSVHEGTQAESMGADAYAQGNQIHFQPGKYNPTSQVGQQLLGHELTHVVQQRAGQVAAPQGKGAPINSDPKLEQEADMLGAKAAQGEQVQVAGAGSGIQRQATSQLGHNFAPAVQLARGRGTKRKNPPSSSGRSSSSASADRSRSPSPASRASQQSRSPSPASRASQQSRSPSPAGSEPADQRPASKQSTSPSPAGSEPAGQHPASETPEKSSGRKYDIGQHGAKKKEQQRLGEAYGTEITGNSHQSEHPMAFEKVLNEGSSEKRGEGDRSKKLEQEALAYQETRDEHRAHIGTGKPSNKPDRLGSGFSRNEYFDTQRRLVEDQDVSSAVQINQSVYAHNPNFQQKAKTTEGKASTDSFNTAVKKTDSVTYATGPATEAKAPVDDTAKAEMIVGRDAATTGKQKTDPKEQAEILKPHGLDHIPKKKDDRS